VVSGSHGLRPLFCSIYHVAPRLRHGEGIGNGHDQFCAQRARARMRDRISGERPDLSHRGIICTGKHTHARRERFQKNQTDWEVILWCSRRGISGSRDLLGFIQTVPLEQLHFCFLILSMPCLDFSPFAQPLSVSRFQLPFRDRKPGRKHLYLRQGIDIPSSSARRECRHESTTTSAARLGICLR
jgi:hypothetical protein